LLLHEHPDHLSHSGMLNLTSFRKFIFISDQTLGLENSFLNWTKIYHPWSCHLIVWLGTLRCYKTHLFYTIIHQLLSDRPWVLLESSPGRRSFAPGGLEVWCPVTIHLGGFSQHQEPQRYIFSICLRICKIHLKVPLFDKTVFIVWKGNILTFLNPLLEFQIREAGR